MWPAPVPLYWGTVMVTEIVNDMMKGETPEQASPFLFKFVKKHLIVSAGNNNISIYRNLWDAGVPRKLINLIARMHKLTKTCYRVNGKKSEFVETIQGVPQGTL